MVRRKILPSHRDAREAGGRNTERGSSDSSRPWAGSIESRGASEFRVMLLLRLRRLSGRRGLGGVVFELDAVLKRADSLG